MGISDLDQCLNYLHDKPSATNSIQAYELHYGGSKKDNNNYKALDGEKSG